MEGPWRGARCASGCWGRPAASWPAEPRRMITMVNFVTLERNILEL